MTYVRIYLEYIISCIIIFWILILHLFFPLQVKRDFPNVTELIHFYLNTSFPIQLLNEKIVLKRPRSRINPEL